MRRLLSVAALLSAACSITDTTTSPGSPAATEAGSDRVVLHAYNVRLEPGTEPGSDEIAFIVRAATASLHVVITGPNVDICPVPSPDVASAPCVHRKVAEIDAEGAIIRATDEAVAIDEIAVSYEAADRSTRLELPTIAPRPGESVCKDACNPVFEMTPFRAGRITATATWEGIATGRLLFESGAVSERAYTELGRPYEVISSQEASSGRGAPELKLTATLPAGESALALENTGARPLLEPSIDVTWP